MVKRNICQGLINSINPVFIKREFFGANKKNIKLYMIVIGILNVLHITQTFFYFPAKFIKFDHITTRSHIILIFLSHAFYFICKVFLHKDTVENKVIETENNTINFKDVYYLKDYINNNFEKLQTMKIPCLYGIDKYGKVIIKDMVNFPHSMIMGSTGNGKSSLLNCIIQSSMYYKNSTVYIMTDFKNLELCQYEEFDNTLYINDIQNFLEVLTNLRNFVKTRTEKFKTINAKNIDHYNSMIDKTEKEPYIVIIIDECAELKLHPDKKLVGEIDNLFTEGVNKWRALGIIFIACLQCANGDQFNLNTRRQLSEKICFKVSNRDGEFAEFIKEEIKQLKTKGEFWNRDRDGNKKIIKSFFIQDISMLPNFENSVYEKLYKKHTGKDFKYFKMLPENQKNILIKNLDKNFCKGKTTEKTLEIIKFLKTENWKKSIVPIVPFVKKSVQNGENLGENNLNNVIKNEHVILDFIIKNVGEDGKLPSREEFFKQLCITKKQLATIKNQLWKKGILKKGKNSKNIDEFFLDEEVKNVN